MLDAVEEAQERIRQKQQDGSNKSKQTWAESLITAIIKNLEVLTCYSDAILMEIKQFTCDT